MSSPVWAAEPKAAEEKEDCHEVSPRPVIENWSDNSGRTLGLGVKIGLSCFEMPAKWEARFSLKAEDLLDEPELRLRLGFTRELGGRFAVSAGPIARAQARSINFGVGVGVRATLESFRARVGVSAVNESDARIISEWLFPTRKDFEWGFATRNEAIGPLLFFPKVTLFGRVTTHLELGVLYDFEEGDLDSIISLKWLGPPRLLTPEGEGR